MVGTGSAIGGRVDCRPRQHPSLPGDGTGNRQFGGYGTGPERNGRRRGSPTASRHGYRSTRRHDESPGDGRKWDTFAPAGGVGMPGRVADGAWDYWTSSSAAASRSGTTGTSSTATTRAPPTTGSATRRPPVG